MIEIRYVQLDDKEFWYGLDKHLPNNEFKKKVRDKQLKGFVSVEPEIFGDEQGYCDLSSIHISEDMRNKGIGRMLFLAAKVYNQKHVEDEPYDCQLECSL